MKIKQLSEAVINQIAAGEVIERPSCIIRELLDNSLDAGASKISIEVNLNPLYIKVEDDGMGLEAEEIGLAFKRHTTSKISSLHDVYNQQGSSTRFRGFRGEALASIASVSSVTISSKTEPSEFGSKAFLKEGKIIQQEKKARTRGTTIEIENLFYNAPVRKKFISSPNEQGELIIKPIQKKHIKKEIIHHILASSGVGFSYKISSGDRKDEMVIPPTAKLLDKIGLFFKAGGGKDLKEELLPVTGTKNGFTVRGYVSNSKIREKTTQSLVLMVFNRVIQDYTFIKAITHAYQNIIPFKAYPMAFLEVIPPNESADINVHPQKKEIRFLNQSNFFGAISSIVRENLERSLVAMQRNNLAKSGTIGEAGYSYKEAGRGEVERGTEKDIERESTLALRDYGNYRNNYGDISAEKNPELYSSPYNNFSNSFKSRANPSNNLSESEHSSKIKGEQNTSGNYIFTSDLFASGFKVLGQVAKCYIIFSINNDLYITDQHAAHERINFDRIQAHLNNNTANEQTLLIPLVIEKNSLEKEAILSSQGLLKEFNLEIDDFGENGLRVSSYPSFIPEKNLISILEVIFETILKKNSFTKSEVMRDVSARIACRISVKAGDELSLAEMEALIQEIYEKDYIHTCPHGRPFVKKISEQDLIKLFERNQHIIG